MQKLCAVRAVNILGNCRWSIRSRPPAPVWPVGRWGRWSIRLRPQQQQQATSHSYGASQNSTLCKFVLPGPIVTKLGMADYVGDHYSDANFSYMQKNPERICTHNGSKRVKSAKDVPFGGFRQKMVTPPLLYPKF